MSKARAQHRGGMFDRPGPLLIGVSVAVALLWITFTATLKWHELLVGLVSTALTIAFCLNLLRTETIRFSVQFRDVLRSWQLPAAIIKDCWLVTIVLCQDLLGRKEAGSFYRACGFKTSRHNPLLIGRSALAITYSSMSPNMIVIGIDPAQSLMLFHQIRRDNISQFAAELGAAPAAAREEPDTRSGSVP